jgi:hypothetical protein
MSRNQYETAHNDEVFEFANHRSESGTKGQLHLGGIESVALWG